MGDGVREIPLPEGKVALVDDEDFDLVSEFAWELFAAKWTDYPVTRRWANGKPIRRCKGCLVILRRDPKSGRTPAVWCRSCRDRPDYRLPHKPEAHQYGGGVPMAWVVRRSTGVGGPGIIHHYNGNGLDNRQCNLHGTNRDDHHDLHAAALRGCTHYRGVPTPSVSNVTAILPQSIHRSRWSR
jgi:hypothetical protein